MKIEDWYRSLPMRLMRQQILGDDILSNCTSCYHEEEVGYESRRIKENFKSIIFTEQAFDKSFQQSPWIKHFNNDQFDGVPIDWHVDFGNECNLTCKMCRPAASSAIAAILRRHNKHDGSIKVSWTSNPTAWANFLSAVDNIPLRRIHVMGGEPTMMKKYHEFIDYLIEKKRFEISLSFVSNGTMINQQLLDKLKLFNNIDMEVSIESISKANDYVRQGSDINQLMANIKNLHKQQGDRLQLVLRTVPQLLSISRYVDLIQFAWDNSLIIEGIPLTRPNFLAVNVLPWDYRQQLIPSLEALRDEITATITFNSIQNGRSKGTLAQKLSRECDAMINLLKESTPANVKELRKELVDHCMFWDKEHGYDINEHVPEVANMLIDWGYCV
jgi:sulfatase maturation enzyme AslB (radical SAM superfamily)